MAPPLRPAASTPPEPRTPSLSSQDEDTPAQPETPSYPRPSTRRGRHRGRTRDQYRTRDTPPMMLAFLAEGAEQEKARRAGREPREVAHRGPHPPLGAVSTSLATLSTTAPPVDPPTPSAPASSSTPALFTHGGPGETNRKLHSDPFQWNIPDTASGPPFFHVTATWNARQGGAYEQVGAEYTINIGYWNSLSAAQVAAEKVSRFPKFKQCPKIMKIIRIGPDGLEGGVRDNSKFLGAPVGMPWFDLNIEIVETTTRGGCMADSKWWSGSSEWSHLHNYQGLE